MKELCPKRAGVEHDWCVLGQKGNGRWVRRCNQCLEVETSAPSVIGHSVAGFGRATIKES